MEINEYFVNISLNKEQKNFKVDDEFKNDIIKDDQDFTNHLTAIEVKKACKS